MVKRGFYTHVYGEGRGFESATAAIETFRAETPGIIDQDLPAFVVVKDGKPVGAMHDNDSVILFNFRGDRAIEISMAFDDKEFSGFDRGNMPKVMYAGMLQYDGDMHLPKRFLVEPPKIKYTLSEYLVNKASTNTPCPKRKSTVTSRISGTATAAKNSAKRLKRGKKYLPISCLSTSVPG